MKTVFLTGENQMDGLPRRERYWAVAAIWLALFMSMVDASIANVALPEIASQLHTQPATSIWIINAYQLLIAVLLLPLAALGEIVTFKRVFLAGLFVFVMASVGCCCARSFIELVLARAAQGIGAAGIMSVNPALVRFVYSSKQLGRGSGLNAMVASIASVTGPSLASLILANGSWRWLFAVNVPIGIAALAVAAFALPETPRAADRLDRLSAVLNIAAYGLTILGLDMLTRAGRLVAGFSSMVMGMAFGWWLVRRSLHQARPLIPIDLLRDRLFTLTVITSVASFSVQMLALVALPFFLKEVLQHTQIQTGMLITTWPLAVGIAAPVAGRLADRYPAGLLSGIGLMLLAIGLLLMACISAKTSMAAIALFMAFCGIGFAFFQAPNNRTLLATAPRARAGAAGGMLGTARLTGQMAGATLVAILFKMTFHGAVWSLLLGAGIAAAAACVSFSRLALHGE
jgi:DHA2 family multidrug resistance protein-like MFS transporter